MGIFIEIVQSRRISLPANIVNQVRSTKYLYENSRSNKKEDYTKEVAEEDTYPTDFVES